MSIQDRRHDRQHDNGRRVVSERRISSSEEYNGIERRCGGNRRIITDRRNLQ